MSPADASAVRMGLPRTHPARAPFAAALLVSAVTGVAFTVFAVVTTQIAPVRAGAPWQDDPYNGMVSFTEFLVPALLVAGALRFSLFRRGHAYPVFRVFQLLRFALVGLILTGATVVVDTIAVILRADRSRWTACTPWLVANLIPLGLLSVGGAVLVRRAAHRLRPLESGRDEGDCLDDLGALLGRWAATLPLTGRARGRLGRAAAGIAVPLLRRHIVAACAVLSLLLSLAISTREAVAVEWHSPLLYATFAAIVFGGFFAFCLVADLVLLVAVRPAAPPHRRALRAATVAGLVALPVSAVFRDSIWSLVSDARFVASIPVFAGIVAVSGLSAFTVALLLVLPARGRTRRGGG